MLPTGATRYHPPMAKIPVAATAPSKSATGANFVKSKGGGGVRQARSRGENRAIPATHCASKRKNFTTGY